VAAAHLEFFDSVAAIADAKAEIFEGMGADGAAVLNRDNAYFATLAISAADHGVGRVIGFGAHPEADVRLLDLVLDDGEARVRASVAGRMVGYGLRAAGRHWAFNSLAVLAAAHAMDADVARAAASLADFEPPKGRGRLFRIAMKGGELDLIDESYNASPAATRAALAVLADVRTGAGEGVEGRRIAVLGDMLELGPGSDRLHAALVDHILAAGVDIVFCVGQHMGALYAALPEAVRGSHALRTEDLVADVLSAVKPGDVVLIKGSLGSRMAPMVDALKALNGSARRGRPSQSAR
jgi:UDP-N-acetylmuramoyl-tripeptide--D-alanyl-D-alanine ligase